MTREGALLITLAFVAVLIGIGVVAWRRRSRRDAGLAAPLGDVPAGAAVRASAAGFYVATTRHGEPLERLAIGGLGFRSRVDVTVTDAGVALDLTGQPRLFLPADRIVSAEVSTVAIDRVVEPGGLARLTWTAARTGADPETVDTYLRPQDTSARVLADEISAILSADAPTGTDA